MATKPTQHDIDRKLAEITELMETMNALSGLKRMDAQGRVNLAIEQLADLNRRRGQQ